MPSVTAAVYIHDVQHLTKSAISNLHNLVYNPYTAKKKCVMESILKYFQS